MGTVAPSTMENSRSTGRGSAILRLLLTGLALASLGTIESRRADSVVPAIDDHLLGVLQKFLPPGRKGPLVPEGSPDRDTRVFAPAPDDSLLPVPLCRYEKADQSILVQWPPGPVDLAMAIETLGAAASLALAWTPDWDAPAEGSLALRAFANARAQAENLPFLHAYWPGFTAAADEAASALLGQLPSLDPAKVRGDAAKIPEVNDPGPWLPETTGLRPADAGFGRLLLMSPLEAPPGRVALPMLARAGDRILPSLALLTFARANQINLSSMDVHLGRAILAGNTAIPIDERGCLLLPLSFANRVLVFSPLAEDAHSIVRGKPVVIAYEGLPAQGRVVGDIGLWTAAALGAMEAGDFALPIRILRRAPAMVEIGVMAVLIIGSIGSLWLPRRHRWWVAIGLFAVLALCVRHAADAQGQFIGLSVPLGLWLATSLMAMRLAPPTYTKSFPTPTTTELPAPSPVESPQVMSQVAEPVAKPSPERELHLADPRRSADPGKKKPKAGKRRRKG